MKLSNIIKKGLTGVAVMLAINIAVSCITGFLIWKEVLPLSAVSVISMLQSGLTVFGVSLLVLKTIPQSKLPVALGMSGAYVLLNALAGTAIKSEGLSVGPLYLIIPFAAAIGAGLMGSRKKTRRR